MAADFRQPIANHAFRFYFRAHLPETEADSLNYEAVKTALEGLSRRKVELLRLVYTDEAEKLSDAVRAVVWAEAVPEVYLWKLVRNATRRFAEARKL